MTLGAVQAIVKALGDAKVRYLIVGGLAVNVHGYRRYTKDVDLVIELSAENVSAAFTALESIGYRPRVPLTAGQFADKALREQLIEEKGMLVLQFWCDAFRETGVDVFVKEPFDFEREFARSVEAKLSESGIAHIVSIPALIQMKSEAGRPQDLADIDQLRELERNI